MNICVKNKKLSGSIDTISSKSHAQRAIFAAILARGKSHIKIDTISKDIESAINVAKNISCNVYYENKILSIDSSKKFPIEVVIDINESGTSLRFLLSILAVLNIKAKIIRRGSLINRNNDVLINLLKSSGVYIKENGEFIYIDGRLKNGFYNLRGDVSSQFVSSLLIALSYFKEKSSISLLKNLESRPYVDVTIDVLKNFSGNVIENKESFIINGPLVPCKYEVERDWSNALFFIVCGVNVLSLNLESKQADAKAMDFIRDLGYENISEDGVKIFKVRNSKKKRILDARHMPDAIPILSIMAAKEKGFTKIINIERLRLKESDRVKSTVELLNKLGVDAKLVNNSIEFNSVEKFKSARINSYNDHRIAMSAIIAATFSKSEVIVDGVSCIDKSYPNFLESFRALGGDYNVI